MGILNGKRILIVEDDPIMLHVLTEAIRRGGATTVHASNGADALVRIDSDSAIDLIISDIQMPHVTGTEMVKQLKERMGETPPVLLMSGRLDIKEDEAIAIGAAGIIHKPFNFTNFSNKLAGVLGAKNIKNAA